MDDTRLQAPSIRSRTLTRSGRHTVAGDLLAAEIVECARNVMLESGAAAYSVRKVAKVASVSIGHLQHYFPTGLDLQLAILESIGARFYTFFASEIAAIGDPVERLVACAKYVLDQDKDQNHVALIREFWVLASRDEQIASLLSDFYGGCRGFIAVILCEANPDLSEEEADNRSRAVVSLLSGSFLYLDPTLAGQSGSEFREHLLQTVRDLAFFEQGPPRRAV